MNSNGLPYQISVNRIMAFIASSSLFLLICSFVVEFLSDAKPCQLCIWQRCGLFFIFCLAFVGLFHQNKQLFALMLFLSSIIMTLLAMYHTSIQLGLIEDRCVIQKVADFSSYREMILNSPTPCSKISLSILGIPAPVINFAFAFVCAIRLARFLAIPVKSDKCHNS